MDSGRSRSMRLDDVDLEMETNSPTRKGYFSKFTNNFCWKPASGSQNRENGAIRKNFSGRELSRVFSEDYEAVDRMILDPRGPIVNRWNKIFLVACFVSLFVDPLFFYLPRAKGNLCITVSVPLEIALTLIRSLADAFYFFKIFVRLRTAYIAPSSRVLGRGELVIDPTKVASKYLHKDFWFDVLAALPFPQVLVWAVIPSLRGSSVVYTKAALRLVILFQYLLRLYLIFPLSSQIIKATGVVMETAWAGAAYNLMLYMLASHVIGACWYLLSVERLEECWREVCRVSHLECHTGFFDCQVTGDYPRRILQIRRNISTLCDPRSDLFQFGIHADALIQGVTGSKFFRKYFYCLWWGLRNLSSLGQNLETSTYVGEISFAIIIGILGLVLFGLLIGNMQTYLQSTTVRLEEWRTRRTDTEQWMRHRQLPHELKQGVRRYNQYRWAATRGVDEESILKTLPVDLRRDIKRHLCLDLVRQVPLFDLMDDMMLDAICERLKPCLSTAGTCLVREGDPVNEMIFIVRGHLDSYTTDGGRKGFFNSCRIGPGDFCGEELLTWALHPRPSLVLPSSTRTVKGITAVEAFALVSDDLKFVASQFRRLHSKQLRHTFRSHSPQWRTWAACFIQAAWFRYKKRKEADEVKKTESLDSKGETETETEASAMVHSTSEFAAYTPIMAASGRRGGSRRSSVEYDILNALQKPKELDFVTEY